MCDAVLEGAAVGAEGGVEVRAVPALAATAVDVLRADGYVLGTPANLGYMSGALKHFFDTIYYPCLEATRKRPFGAFLHGNNDTDGALLGIQKITTGLQWRESHSPVQVVAEPSKADLDDCWDLGATLAALLASTP